MNVSPVNFLSRGAAAILATLAVTVAGHAGGDGPRGDLAAIPDQAIPAERARPPTGKVRPPVEVNLAPGTKLQSGVPAQLVLQVRAAAGIERIELAVEGDEGLEVVSASRELRAGEGNGSPSVGEAARFEISATPTSGGTRHLSGLVTFSVNGVPQAAPFNLRVEVAGPVTVPSQTVQKPARPAARDTTGELVDSMSAETIVR